MLPVGQWVDMQENKRGLKVDGRLFALNTERGQYLYEGLKAGVLDGLSIGYKTREFMRGTKPGEPERTLTNIDLWEVSIVTFPANPQARVGAVKMTKEHWSDLEDALRDGGLSGSERKRALTVFRRWLPPEAAVPGHGPHTVEAPPDAEDLLSLLGQTTDMLQARTLGRVLHHHRRD
jgi:hypothetical protein